jgi:ketosteroid isomerase-like protein
MSQNKRVIEHVYAELSRGNSRPFVDALADDVRWSMIGRTAWSGVYEGKEAVLKTLLAPLRAQFEGQYTARAERLIAEGDDIGPSAEQARCGESTELSTSDTPHGTRSRRGTFASKSAPARRA